jgi:hypothetical protein
MEDVIADGGGTQWYQLYVWQDAEAAWRGQTRRVFGLFL